MFRRPRQVSVVLALLVTALLAVGCEPAGFYNTATAIMPDAPGDVARSYSYGRDIVSDADGNMSAQQTAHVVVYRSTSATGEAILVSGTVIVPNEPWTLGGERPIVALAAGTQGLGDQCAPSKVIRGDQFGEEAQVDAILGAGFAVAMTDYQGLGTPGDHTYGIVDAQAHAMLDIARAARRLDAAGLAGDAPVALWGYSQGGSAAARAAEIEAAYAPDLDVKAVAAGGVPTDPFRQVEWVRNPLGRGYGGVALMSIVGLLAAYPELDAEAALTEEGRALAEEVKDLCAIDAIYLGAISDLEAAIIADVVRVPAWRARIDQQRLGISGPRVPALVYHGTLDGVVPIDQAYRLRDGWCLNGSDVEYREFPGDHFFIGQAADSVVVPWLASYLTGDTTPASDC